MALNASRSSLGAAPATRLGSSSSSRRAVVVVVAVRAEANRSSGSSSSSSSSSRPRANANDVADVERVEQQQQQHQQPLQRLASPATNLAATAGRRPVLAAALAAAAGPWLLVGPQRRAALAFEAPPPGYRLLLDRLDGYSFFYPESWQQVTTSGNDVFFRNPRSAAENLFVDLSSPSSSRFASVDDLGSPEDAAARLLDTFLNREFMSTRLGVKREGEVLSAVRREGPADPETGERRAYVDVDVRLRSFASRSPYVVSSREMMTDYGIEWDRRLMTTLGVANKRLYSLRLQTDYADEGEAAAAPSAGAGAPASTPAAVFAAVRGSFGVREVEPQ
jgi:hypothetical protein